MSQEEPSLIRPDHADAPVSVSGGDVGFEPSFQPGNVPKLSVPDLPEDATGLSPEELAHVPTLTEQVNGEPEVAPDQKDAPILLESIESSAEATPLIEAVLADEATQEPEVQADTWVEQLQVRMDRLMDDIHALNDRLDRLEKNKTKV